MENKVCLVVDLGSAMIKAGVAGEEIPQDIIPTIFGRSKYGEVELLGLHNRENFCGHTAY